MEPTGVKRKLTVILAADVEGSLASKRRDGWARVVARAAGEDRADAHCATIVGDREEPSGESRLEPQEGTIKGVRD